MHTRVWWPHRTGQLLNELAAEGYSRKELQAIGAFLAVQGSLTAEEHKGPITKAALSLMEKIPLCNKTIVDAVWLG